MNRQYKNALLSLVLALLPPVSARAQSLLYLTPASSRYALDLDTTPAPAVFVAYCGNCLAVTPGGPAHLIYGPAHDLLALARNGVEVSHLGVGWLYAPGTTGTLATGGAVVAKFGVNLGLATQQALGRLPVAADAVGATQSWVTIAENAVSFDGFYGVRAGGASGIPKNPWGFGVNLSSSWTISKVVSLFTGS